MWAKVVHVELISIKDARKLGQRLGLFIKDCLIMEKLDNLARFLLIALWDFVFCSLVLTKELHDLVEGLMLIEMLQGDLEPDAINVIQVLAACHRACIAEIVSRKILELLERL